MSMGSANSYHRRELRKHVPCTDGIPNYLLSTVTLLRSSFPEGMEIGSADYFALWSLLDNEGFTFRAIATALDFAFGLGYVEVYGAYGKIEGEERRRAEIIRVESLLEPHGLDKWRAETS